MRFPPLFVALSLFTSSGCIGPAADVAANGLVLGGPADPAFAILADSFDAGVVLARPVNFVDLEKNLLDAEAVWLELATEQVELRSADTGLYVYDPLAQPSAVYTAGTEVTIHATVQGVEGSATVVAPAAPDLATLLPDVHVAGSSMRVNLANEDYALVYGAVLDSTGAVLWDDRPESSEEIIAALRESGAVNEYLFPASAFPDRGARYGVALVGIKTASGGDFDNFERFWSNFGVGAIGTKLLVTAP